MVGAGCHPDKGALLLGSKTDKVGAKSYQGGADTGILWEGGDIVGGRGASTFYEAPIMDLGFCSTCPTPGSVHVSLHFQIQIFRALSDIIFSSLSANQQLPNPWRFLFAAATDEGGD